MYLSGHLATVATEEDDGEYLLRAVARGKWDSFMRLENLKGESIDFPKTGILIDWGFARKNNLKAGDKLTIWTENEDEKYNLEIKDIYKNYIGGGFFIGLDEAEKIFGDSDYTGAYLKTEDEKDIMTDIMKMDQISSLTRTADLRESFDSSMEAINLIIVLVIIFAGMLAFVVIYNLTNINLTERQREIATIQVLGFRDHELLSYVFRENLFLAIIGGTVGLVLGKLLHSFILDNISVAEIVLLKKINWFAYVAAFVLTILFSFMMRLFMRKKVIGINMADSLKAVE